MNRLRPLASSCSILLTLCLASCASAAVPAAAPTSEPSSASDSSAASEPDPGHGAVAGAAEQAEPQLHLVTVDTTGRVGLLDLLDGTEHELGTVTAPEHLSTDGRYGFAAHESGVDVIDSAVWTWDHGDHSHYYRGEPSLLGTVAGSGIATVVGGPLSTAESTGVFFPESGEAVLLDNAALSRGTVQERFRLRVTPHDGILAPFDTGAVISETDDAGRPSGLRYLDANGAATPQHSPCLDPRAAQMTRAGLVVACADGAVVVSSGSDDAPVFEHIPAPVQGAAPTTLSGRKGRPALAGPSPATGIWLFDSRARSWDFIASDAQYIAATAVGDAAAHVVAVDAAGSVHVFRGGVEIAVTDPLLTSADLASGSGGSGSAEGQLTLSVDAQRAYLASPERATVYEIDFADNARVSREFTPAIAPARFAETGR